MPPAVAAVAVVAAGAAAAASVITVTTAMVIGAMALAASALLNKPKMPGSGTSPSDRKQVIRAAASPMVGVVGNTQISGVLTFAEEIKSEDELNLAVALSGHTKPEGEAVISSVNKVLMDDQEVPLGSSHDGNVFVRVYDGSQKTINDLGSELRNLPSWRSDMVGKGVCFAHIRCKYDSELFPNGMPNFVFELDSGSTVSLSSDAILDYLQNNFGATDDEIDFDSFNAARPICNETVNNGAGGTEPRYTCNGAYNYDESHKQIIDKMLLTSAGQLTYINGKFGLKVGAYNGPADFILTENDIVGDVTVKPQPDRQSLINVCKGKHVWPDAKFQEVDFPGIHSDQLVTEDGEELEKDLNLEFCHSPYQCQRLAANDITRARLPVIKVPCNMRAFECYLGRNIKLHMPSIGYENKECVVEGWELNPEKGVTLTLREDSPEAWTDIVGKVPVLPPDVKLPNPRECASVANTQFSELEVDGVWEARLTWEHPHPASIYKYKVVLEKLIGSDWIEKFNSEVSSRFFVISNPVSADYRITITAVNRFDVSSVAVAHPFTVTVPEIRLTAIAPNVDNSIYPATAVVIANVLGDSSFPAESVSYESETRITGEQWFAAGSSKSPSARLTGLTEGLHQVRMRAIPPYGDPSSWVQTQFNVYAADQPTALVFTADASFERWGCIEWQGAGQSWEVEVRNESNEVLWSDSFTERKAWLDWRKPGLYSVAVRARAGSIITDWSVVSELISSIAPPSNLTFDTSAASPGSTGTLKWDSADGRSQRWDVEIIADGVRTYSSPSYERSEPLPVLLPGSYTFRVRTRWNQEVSGWASVNFGYQVAPDDIQELQLRALGNQAILSWAKPGADVFGSGFVQVRHTPVTGVSVTWENAIPLTDRLQGNTTQVQVPLLSGTYLVKSVNSSEIWSDNAASVVSNMAASIGYNRIVQRVEPDTWAGDKNKATAAGSSITLKDSSVNTAAPYYTMAEPLDLGGVFTVRLQMSAEASVYEQDLIDDRTTLIDTWGAIDGAKAGGSNLQYYVSMTDDDPAGSPNWSAWTQFILGEFRARAFRLQVRLLAGDDKAAGTVSNLTLTADVPDRQEQASNINVSAGGKTISYAVPFMSAAKVFITGHNLQTGDYYRITSSTKNGFTIQWLNSSGQGIARDCDWLAISYGES